MAKVRTIVLRAAGTNCDVETAFAFRKAGSQVDLVHINRLAEHEVSLDNYEILAIPGGFTYGDDISAGRVLANELRYRVGKEIRRFVDSERLVLGICNGFQVLVKMGLLPGWSDGADRVTLTNNDSNRFEDRWVYLNIVSTKSPFLREEDIVYLPVAHAEGKFVADEDDTLRKLEESGQIIVTYCGKDGNPAGYPANPNGSMGSVAGISDITGRVFGLMPHPERNVEPFHHPRWTRGEADETSDGLRFFRNAVAYFQ